MSARPFIPRLEGEELDLLISRSLDGDLSPEETRDLETVLANDPAARRRQEELAGIVAEARALPEPAPPFALSTRVNSNVSEKTARGGSIFHRFGFYPPPGMAIGAMVVLGVVAVMITVLNPAPKRTASIVAQKADGPVDVFFQEGARAKDAGKKAPAAPSGSASDSSAPKVAAKEESLKTREEGAASPLGPARQSSGAPASIVAMTEPAASAVASNEAALDEKGERQYEKLNDRLSEKQKKLAKSETDADTSRTLQAAAEAPALAAAAPQAAGGIAPMAPAAPAARAPAVRALRSVETRTWAVAIRGEGAKRWMLRRAPDGRPLASPGPASSFRVTLDAEGRVIAVRALDTRSLQPALLEFVRGLVFTPKASAVGAVADGFARDREQREQKAKDDRADALSEKNADKPAEHASETEIEVEVSAH